MRFYDFCLLTPIEFQEVMDVRKEYDEAIVHDDWERMRLLATLTIQPHVKGRMIPERLLPLPWDNKGRHRTENEHTLSREEQKRRFEKLMKAREENSNS